MLTNICGLVKSLRLGQSHGTMPLYEAISNAIDAIADNGKNVRAGRIDVYLHRKDDLVSKGGSELGPMDGFAVTDNGVGFNNANFSAFKEAYTLNKVKFGGKGVGRFTYLKVFDDVLVESIFENDGHGQRRRFRFSIDQEVHDASLTVPAELETGTGTTVTFARMSELYRTGWPREPEIIAQRIVAHFLIRFAARSCPPAWLHDPGHESIDLHRVFDESIQPHIEELSIAVRGHEFALQVFRHKGSRERHELIYCVAGREAMKTKLRCLLPELPDRFLATDDHNRPYALLVLVTGEYLDENANTERTEVIFNPADDDLASVQDRIKRTELEAEIGKALRRTLSNDSKVTNEEKRREVNRLVENAPEYRVLLGEQYRELIEQRVPPGCTDETLDEHLLHLRREIEDKVREEGREIVALVEETSFDEYKVKMNTHIERINDVGKSQLASYIAHRRAILDLLALSLKKSREDKKYRLEQVLHNMIFPMGETSKEVFIDQQNLWIIDERLSFHTILTSDKKLNSVSGLERTSGREPDLFAFFYDTPVGVQEIDDTSGAVVIIEFKRPGRDDYKADPAQQVIQRFVEIDEGEVKDIDGRPINPANLRYFGYLIADLEPSLKRQMQMNYHRAVDGEGYFKTLTNGNGYVEILSYDKLLKDAKQRNRRLFEKLGLHKH